MPGLVRLASQRLPGQAEIAVAAAPKVEPAGAGTAPLSMVLEGEVWAVAHGGATFRFKDSLGLQYLARLVREPGREVHVLALVGSAAGDPGQGQVVDQGDSGELLDDEARADYRRRLEDLRDTLAEAESFGDAARASRAREEIEFLGARRAGSAAERARSAVQRRIKNALERIGETAPALGAYLGRTVKTGNFCMFRPEPG
jgi:hypothetical protein